MIRASSVGTKVFLTIWPILAFAGALIPLPFIAALWPLAVFGVAIAILMAKTSFSYWRRACVLCLWFFGILCLSYAVIAFGEAVQAADNLEPEPFWSRGVLPALLVGLLCFAFGAIVVWRRPKADDLNGGI